MNRFHAFTNAAPSFFLVLSGVCLIASNANAADSQSSGASDLPANTNYTVVSSAADSVRFSLTRTVDLEDHPQPTERCRADAAGPRREQHLPD